MYGMECFAVALEAESQGYRHLTEVLQQRWSQNRMITDTFLTILFVNQ